MASTPGQRFCYTVCLLFVFYSVGVFVFRSIERPAELQRYTENRELYEEMKELYSFEHCNDPAFQSLTFCKDQAKFGQALKDYFNERGHAVRDQEQWTFLGTAFFLTHLSTTIGYGSSHASTSLGQFATIFFAVIGIPILGYTLAQVARMHLRGSVFLVERVLCTRMNTVRRQMGILWCLLVLFLFGGAFIYTILEPWTYVESLYFCFVTLSTVGFGDYLPSTNTSRLFSMFFMIFGLGVCASIIAVLTGFVAESHDSVDSYLSEKIPVMGSIDCCATKRSAED